MKFSDKTVKLIYESLKEDIGSGDITSESIFSVKDKNPFTLISKENGIICGLPLVKIIFNYLNKDIIIKYFKSDGDEVYRGDEILTIEGCIIDILKGERVMLNFLQRLSAIATKTNKYVKIASKYGVKILDTRKTTPLWRELEKYAVRIGGGSNHRMGLYDMALIKDNHIDACGSIKNAVERVKKSACNVKIEVEVRNFDELKEALEVEGIDIIMLDNMSPSEIKKAVEIIKGRVKLEASGGINLSNVEEYAKTGVDFISIGELTHSIEAFDLSLVMKK